MRRVVLFIATSLDGFIAGPKHELDWLFTQGEYGYTAFEKTFDVALMGRTTYEHALKMTKGKDPYPGKTSVVFTRDAKNSKHLPKVPTGARVLFFANPAQTVRALKAKRGKTIFLVGGSELNTTLLAAGLVDQLVLSIHPVILGNGVPLFSRAQSKRVKLKLTQTRSYPTGLVQLHYDVR